jgi:hypothetical protein
VNWTMSRVHHLDVVIGIVDPSHCSSEHKRSGPHRLNHIVSCVDSPVEHDWNSSEVIRLDGVGFFNPYGRSSVIRCRVMTRKEDVACDVLERELLSSKIDRCLERNQDVVANQYLGGKTQGEEEVDDDWCMLIVFVEQL